MQALFEDSLATLLSHGFLSMGLSFTAGLLDREILHPSKLQDISNMVRASSACRPALPVNSDLTSSVTSWRMQAATYCFVLGAAHLVSIDQCFSTVLGHGALQQHGIAQSVHSILQASQPRRWASSVVWSRAHLEPARIVSCVRPLYLQTLRPGAVPATQVPVGLPCMARPAAYQATASCLVPMSVHS